MEIHLQQMRRRTRLKQAEVAERLGVEVRTYSFWECDEAMMSLEQVYDRAVLLDCSIDEMAGMPGRDPLSFANSREAELYRCYRSCDRERQVRLLDTARDFAGMSWAYSEPALPEAGGEVA